MTLLPFLVTVTITKLVPGDRSLNSLSVQEQRKSELKRIKRAYALEVGFISFVSSRENFSPSSHFGANFQASVDSNLRMFWIWFITLSNWFTNLMPPSQHYKTTANKWSSEVDCGLSSCRKEAWENSGVDRIRARASLILVGAIINSATKPYIGSEANFNGFIFPLKESWSPSVRRWKPVLKNGNSRVSLVMADHVSVLSSRPLGSLWNLAFKMYFLFQDSTYCEQPTDGTLAGKYKNRAEVRLALITFSWVLVSFYRCQMVFILQPRSDTCT